MKTTTYAWCIEKDHPSTPLYLTVKNSLFDWSQDNGKAIRFSRREDAEMVASVIGEDADRIAEHGWEVK